MEGNGGDGVTLWGTSYVHMYGEVRNNGGNGFVLRDTAALGGCGSIHDNLGYGIICAETPSVPGIHGNLCVPGSNGLGAIACPGMMIP